jgi:hypothetical protein
MSADPVVRLYQTADASEVAKLKMILGGANERY